MSASLVVILSKDGHFEELVDTDGNVVHCDVEEINEEIAVAAAIDAEKQGEWHPDEQVADDSFKFCGQCHKTYDEVELAICTGCNVEHYCIGTNCRVQHWTSKVNSHKDLCPKLREGMHLYKADEPIEADLDSSEEDVGDEYNSESSSEEEVAADVGRPRGRGGRPRGRGGRPRGRGGRRGPRRTRRMQRRGRMQRRWRRGPRGRRAWGRRFRGRPWYRPGLYPWFTLWNPLWPFIYATDAFLYTPRSPASDPLWYFDPMAPPQQIEQQRKALMVRYADVIANGYGIVPDFDMGRFRWIRRV